MHTYVDVTIVVLSPIHTATIASGAKYNCNIMQFCEHILLNIIAIYAVRRISAKSVDKFAMK